jgi:hypothetical protein
VAKFSRPTLDARADQRHGIHEFGVQIALHDLRGNRRGPQAQRFADVRFHFR